MNIYFAEAAHYMAWIGWISRFQVWSGLASIWSISFIAFYKGIVGNIHDLLSFISSSMKIPCSCISNIRIVSKVIFKNSARYAFS